MADDRPSVAIQALSVTPGAVADGASFTVAWEVSYTNAQGLFTELGLYLGMPGDLATADARDRRALFSLADTAGLPSRPASTMSCTRSGTSVRCADGSAVTVPTGEVAMTFRLCSEKVLDSSSQVCTTRPLSVTFP